MNHGIESTTQGTNVSGPQQDSAPQNRARGERQAAQNEITPANAQRLVAELSAVFSDKNAGAAPKGNLAAKADSGVDTLGDGDKKMIVDSINNGKKVFVAGFSSQGGGHTERMMKPLGQALSSGDTVVMALPPHWENDTGNEAGKLASFSQKYQSDGANVVTVQADKAILGFYEKDGSSDNFRILEEFAMKPQRNTDQTPLYGVADNDAATGQGFKHKDIVSQIVNVVGQDNLDQITVFEDMDPYLGKAAAKAGIPSDQIVGQSNHVTMLDADDFLAGKSDAFLVKANGNGYNGKVATIDYDANVNKTASLGGSLDKLGIGPDQRTEDVRKDVVATFMQHGNKIHHDHEGVVTKAGSVIVSQDATAESIDRGVYLYLNSYTPPLAEHIKDRLNPESDTPPELFAAYEKAMFVVCGKEAFPEAYRNTADVSNAMHLAQAANFDGVINAGFGTSSEMQYLLENNAYEGNFVMMPIERQHEQETNAFVLTHDGISEGNQDRLTIANTMQELTDQLDDLVMNRATTTQSLGQANSTMAGMLDATHMPGAIADKAAGLLNGTGEMSALDSRLLTENNNRASDIDRKEARQLNKVMIPVLAALVDDQPTAAVHLSEKVAPVTINVADFVQGMQNPDTQQDTLLNMAGVDVTGGQSTRLVETFAAGLSAIMDQPQGEARQQAADDYRRGEYANNVYTVGY